MSISLKEVQELNEESFETWWKEWSEECDLDFRIITAAKEGLEYICIHVEEVPRVRFKDTRFLKKLQFLYPDFNVDYRLNFFDSPYSILISWREKS